MLNKELQDLAWSVLPKEFKEEVKSHYAELNAAYKAFLSKDSLTNAECDRCNAIREKMVIYNRYFGHHNLTSDAEGEVELLHVTRQKVMGLYANAKKIHDLYTSATCINTKESQQIDICKGVMSILDTLFGSKCLPDEDSPIEATSAQTATSPTFKAGNKVYCISPEYKGVYKVCRYIENGCYSCVDSDGYYFVFHESNLEPYTEPEENHIAGERKMVDNIIKDGFSKERRLNIAAMIAQGILTRIDDTPQVIAEAAFRHADALITESERGGSK